MLVFIESPQAKLNKAKLMVRELLRSRGSLTREEVVAELAEFCAAECVEQAITELTVSGQAHNSAVSQPSEEEGPK